MVRPKELIESIIYILKDAPDLPSSINFVGYEPDIDSESIKLPLIEVSLETQIEINEANTEFVSFKTDDEGNQIGRVYESLYTQDIHVSIWTAQGSKYSPRELNNVVRDTLYKHTTTGPNEPLVHPELGCLDEVWRVKLIEGSHTDDLGTSPTLRRWDDMLEISASERHVTDADEPPIEGFNENVQ